MRRSHLVWETQESFLLSRIPLRRGATAPSRRSFQLHNGIPQQVKELDVVSSVLSLSLFFLSRISLRLRLTMLYKKGTCERVQKKSTLILGFKTFFSPKYYFKIFFRYFWVLHDYFVLFVAFFILLLAYYFALKTCMDYVRKIRID